MGARRTRRWLLGGGGLVVLLAWGLCAVDPGRVADEEPGRHNPKRHPHSAPAESPPATADLARVVQPGADPGRTGNGGGARLRLAFLDRQGRPVPGVRVELTHRPDLVREAEKTTRVSRGGPARRDPTRHDPRSGKGVWVGESAADGVVSWSHLPPAATYRFSVTSGHAVRCRPRGVLPGRSGEFALTAAAAVEFVSRVLSGSIRGRFPVRGGTRCAAVLFRVEGAAEAVLRSVARAVPDPGTGRFSFGAVEEGRYVIRCQRVGQDVTEFASRRATVSASQWQVDLGEIEPDPGFDLVVRARPVDRFGDRVVVEDLDAWPSLRVALLAGVRGAPADRLQDRFALRLERDHLLRGLPESGRVRLHPRGPNGPLPEGWRMLPEGPGPSGLWVEDRAARVIVPVPILRLRPLQLRLERPGKPAAETVRVSLAAPGFRHAEEFSLAAGASSSMLRVSGSTERVQVYVRLDRGDATWAALGAWSPGQAVLRLTPVACPTRAVAVAGPIQAGVEVGYGPAALPFPVARARIDPGGRLRCRGIPPAGELAVFGLEEGCAPREASGRRVVVRAR